MSAGQPLKVTICGAGRTGHLAAVLFGQRPDVEVTLLSGQTGIPALYRNSGARLRARLPDGSELTSTPACVTANPEEGCRDADIAIVTAPSHARERVLQSLAPALPRHKPVFVGAIPGFNGFDWLAERWLGHLGNVVLWGMKDVPHIAFDLKPGRSVRLGGAKSQLYVATHRRQTREQAEMLLSHLRRLYQAPVSLLHDYLEITLTPGNPIMHSAVIYGLIGPWGQWHNHAFSHIPCWWNDCPELGAYFLARCDAENQALCRAAETTLGIDLSSVQPLLQEIVEAYGEQIADRRTLLSTLRTNRAYHGISLPLLPQDGTAGYQFDRQHRVFQEDIACGLGLLVALGDRLRVPVPQMREIFLWCRDYMGNAPPHVSLPDEWPLQEAAASCV
ncbi:NAD/NADP octopine/nopaline dehydrogenase family protein [Budvicia diplopodorum]|uniref:NAD/NADP octopine/nopaline dehydrogenase family protein n=1 Tax=Budvicia diplopodorum TaxID=1119056 RepID=UPI00135CA21D|nr:NAD/NADP octopine/nopaline dehydrogenase family protein [Budvicia diplopodorum]